MTDEYAGWPATPRVEAAEARVLDDGTINVELRVFMSESARAKGEGETRTANFEPAQAEELLHLLQEATRYLREKAAR